MTTPTDFDERSLSAFDKLTAVETAKYWWLVFRRAHWVEFVTGLILSTAGAARRTCSGGAFWGTMLWVYWRSARVDQVSLGQQDSSAAAADSNPSAGENTQSPDRAEPHVYETALGNRVIDKRRRPTVIPEEGHAESTPHDSSLDESPAAEPVINPSGADRARWRRLVGATIKWSRPEYVPRIDSRALTDMLLTRPALRAITAQRHIDDFVIADVIDVAGEPTMGDWRLAAYLWLREFGDPQVLADLVTAGLQVEPNNPRRAVLLRLVRDIANVLSEARSEELLRYLLSAIETPIDPYEPSGDVLLARRAVASLLRQRPELEKIVLAKVSADARVDDQGIPNSIQLLAVALRERGLGASMVFADAANQARLTKKEVESLARLADAPLHANSPVVGGIADRLSLSPGPTARRLLSSVVGAVVLVTSALVARHYMPSFQPMKIEIAPAIATLALLATVQVFAGNLSGSRLPSTIARYTSQSWQLDVAYFASVSLIFLAVFPTGQHISPSWAPSRNWLSTVTLTLWTSMLLMALLTVFRRVDASRAAAGFLSAKKRRAGRVGRRFGRYQALAAELTSIAESSAPVDIQIDAVPDVWDQPIVAARRGIFLPPRRSFRRLMSSQPVRAGLKLRITAVLTSTVNRYDTLAQAVPLRNQTIDRRWLRRARRSIKVRGISAVDDVRSAATALSKLSADLAAANDVGTAHQVAQSLTAFVNYHMLCTRRTRQRQLYRWQTRVHLREKRSGTMDINSPSSLPALVKPHNDDTPTTVNFLLREILELATRAAITSSGPALNVPEYIVRSLLKSNTHEEHGVNVVTAVIGQCTIDSPAKLVGAIHMFRVAGLRALEQRQAISFNLLLDRVVALATDDASKAQLRDLLVDLSAYACRYGPSLATSGCASLEKLFQTSTPGVEVGLDVRGAYHFWVVGAAALAAGALSTAVYVASICRQQQWISRIASASRDYDVVDDFALRAKLFGNYLGELPRDALTTYGRFIEVYRPSE